MPSRGLARTTAPITTVSPYCTVTDPWASLAYVPVSIDSVRPPISRSTRMACIWSVTSVASACVRGLKQVLAADVARGRRQGGEAVSDQPHGTFTLQE